MLVSLDTVLQDALKHQYAVAAFNINFMEQAMAVFDAASESRSPIILQFSSGGLKHAPNWFLRSIFEEAKRIDLPVVIHRDHCHSIQEFEQAMEMGFQSIMMDGSLAPDGTPRNFEENVLITHEAMTIKPLSVCVEAELGCLGSLKTGKSGSEDGFKANKRLRHEQLLTDPKQAKRFLEHTGVHALAIAIGTSHGAYKFSEPPTHQTLDVDRVKEISENLPFTPLVLHGGSSIPKALREMINAHGGNIPKTYGVPITAIQKAIRYGVCKVNIDSDLRLATTAAFRKALSNSLQFDPRACLKPAYELMKEVCIERYHAFGSAMQAERIINHEAVTA